MSRRLVIGGGAALAALVALGAIAVGPLARGLASREDVPRATVAVSDALGARDTAGFERALGPQPLSFPGDDGPHPGFRTEWWYYTGNLETAAGRHVGFQLTFFRTALAPPERVASTRPSHWAASQLYLAHFAVTDTAGRRFHAASRLEREALGLAGAQARRFRVWLGDWSADGEGPDGFPVRLCAADGDVSIDLVLERGKPVVLQGDRGWSAKGPEPGNASYYYSFTRMPARGTVVVRGESLSVSGLAWMDREWSTSALGPDLEGWDWFALQLDDRRDIMMYRLRRRDGSADAYSAGVIVGADGRAERLAMRDVAVEALDDWTSPASGVRYPSRWRVRIPGAGVILEISPRVADQELVVGTRYWEGAVRVEGRADGRPIGGRGYVELVGYGE